MRPSLYAATIALLWLCASPLAAQPTSAPQDSIKLIGTIRDSVTGRPVLRADVCSLIGSGTRLCVRVDSTGYFELAGLRMEPDTVSISCPGERGELSRRFLYRETLQPTDSLVRRRDVRADVTGCDMRPYTVRTGTFVGLYTNEFEGLRFVSCDQSIRAWPTFSPEASARIARVRLPRARMHTLAVTVEGTVRGPGQFGHGGVTPYGIEITRVLSARLATARDCRQ